MNKTLSISIVLTLMFTIFSGIIAFPTIAGTESDPSIFPLYAGQDIEIGEVQVWNDADNLYVKYVINEDGWCITEVHLHIADTMENIPQTQPNKKGIGGGNPIPGHFDYVDEDIDCVTIYEFDPISLEDFSENITIAAHAAVVKYGEECIDFEQYGEYDSVSSVDSYAGTTMFYMTDYTLLESIALGDTATLCSTGELPVIAEENTKNPDHDYIDPYMNNIVGFTVGGTFEDDWVAADPENTGAGGKLLTDTPNFALVPFWQHAYSKFQAILMDFTDVNMLQYLTFAGVDLDWNEVWYILYFNSDNELIHRAEMGPPSGQSQDGYALPITYENPDIDKVVIWGNMNGGEPGKVGFAIDNICFKAVVQEESAWGAEDVGQIPFSGNNWATYFTYTVENPLECPGIDSKSENIELLTSIPSDVRVGALESNNYVRVWKEFEGALTEDLYYDLDEAVSAKTDGPSSEELYVPAGTEVCIFYVHFDGIGGTYQYSSGWITFGADILGVILSGGNIGDYANRDLMFDADDQIGNPATIYPPMSGDNYLRGYDVNWVINTDDIIFNGATVNFDAFVSNAHDSFRVIVPMV